ncbi:MAG TPA: EamA family transporter [bacterium]|nr:EamA family transporter [bacterium]
MIDSSEKKTINKLDYILLHLLFMLYAFISFFEKTASKYSFFSTGFLFSLSGMILFTALYAFLWQKALKKFPLVIAYSNKGVVVVWTMLIGVIYFSEKITFNNILGAAIIITGIALISKNDD